MRMPGIEPSLSTLIQTKTSVEMKIYEIPHAMHMTEFFGIWC